MKAIKLFIKIIPGWAFALVFLAIFTNTVYLTFFLNFSPEGHGYHWSVYLLMVIFSLASLFLLYKKPGDKAVVLFYILLQCLFTTMNAAYLDDKDPLTMLATVVFIFCGNFIGPTLIHFILIFPKQSRFITMYKSPVILLYIFSGLFSIVYSIIYIIEWINDSLFSPTLIALNTVTLRTLGLLIVLAVFTAIYQYKSIRDTLSRIQLMLLMTGILFSLILIVFLILFYEQVNRLNSQIPFLLPSINTMMRLILIGCILIAIFRYRIWNIGVVFKKALLYLGATVTIILVYLVLIFLVGLVVENETNTARFIILTISLLVFLSIRDRIQNLVDRIFHREDYDAVTVVGDFEEKLAGTYRIDDLSYRILAGMDDIFHLGSAALLIRAEGLTYDRICTIGGSDQGPADNWVINNEFDKKLRRNKVFSPGELQEVPSVLQADNAELVVPIIKNGQPFGFFLCGPKKSEKVYSMQDIRVLSLIAKRVIALFHSAALYQKDLDRQLMLERERTRISQDMHDDIGASLTRIALMSDMVKNRDDVGDGAKQWLGHINDTSRGLMEEMNQIIWALNPKNDNLEGLVAYIRRFAFEYLEPSKIKCIFDLPRDLPSRALSVEVRRNVYLVVREALHNAVKHSGASNVMIKIEMNVQGFRVFIKDDGRGFDPGKLKFPGNGLLNMKKRMEDLGGKFDLNSKPGEGTEIDLMVILR